MHMFNKTQRALVDRFVNNSRGSAKMGWTMTTLTNLHHNRDVLMMSLQKLSEINQAYKLAAQYPMVFSIHTVSYRLVRLTCIDLAAAGTLLTT